MAKVEKNILGIFIVVLLAVGAGMFLGGMKYQDSRSTTVASGPQGFGGTRTGGRGQGGGGGGAGGFASGQVISRDDQSITVKLQNGGSTTVYYSGSTTIGKMATGTAGDLTAGTQVIANGTANSDGSIAAQSIQIRPAGSPDGGPGGYGGQGGGSSSTQGGGNQPA